jgi:guanine deaminase
MSSPFLDRAIALARQNVATRSGGPFGAVVVRNGEILAEGVNQVVATLDPTAHAEIVAIRAACRKLGAFDLSGCEIYTSCEPCPMCLAAIYWARAARIIFAAGRADAAAAGFDDDFLYQELQAPLENRRIPLLQADRDQALAVFQSWREDHAKVPY